MAKKNKKTRKQGFVNPQSQSFSQRQSKVSSVTSSSIGGKSPSAAATASLASAGKGLTTIKHQHIIPDLIRIGIIAGVIFVIEIILSFIIH
jgi:hypothetical protein